MGFFGFGQRPNQVGKDVEDNCNGFLLFTRIIFVFPNAGASILTCIKEVFPANAVRSQGRQVLATERTRFLNSIGPCCESTQFGICSFDCRLRSLNTRPFCSFHILEHRMQTGRDAHARLWSRNATGSKALGGQGFRCLFFLGFS
jgi:hypothetical protein